MVQIMKRQSLQAKSSEIKVLMPQPTEDWSLPIDFEEQYPGGTAAVCRITPMQLIVRSTVSRLTKDGAEGVQRALNSPNSKSYFEALHTAITKGDGSIVNMRAAPLLHVNTAIYRPDQGQITFRPGDTAEVDDAQHLEDALKRLYVYSLQSGTDPLEKSQILSFLGDQLLTVRVLLGWDLSDRREFFYRLNGLTKPVAGGIGAFYASQVGIGTEDVLKAAEAVKLIQEMPHFKDRISLQGSGRGVFSFKALRDLLDEHVGNASSTAEEMAITFAAYWTALEQTFPEQKELDSSAMRGALLKAMDLLDNPEALQTLSRRLNGRLESLKAYATSSGTKGQESQLYKALKMYTEQEEEPVLRSTGDLQPPAPRPEFSAA